MDQSTCVSFVRHGHVHNPDDLFYGRLEGFSLSPVGRRQAAAVKDYFKDKNITAVYSSPQLRTLQTAEIILEAHPDLNLRQDDLLNEIYTPYDGKPTSELKAIGWDIYAGTPPEFEQPDDVLRRGLSFVDRVLQGHRGGHILAVTHGDVIAFLVLWATGRPITVAERLSLYREKLVSGSISTLTFPIGWSGQKPAYEYLNPSR